MVEEVTGPFNFGLKLTRRAAVSSFISLSSVPFLMTRGLAQGFDNPPVFATARYQFTMIEPAIQMPAVTLKDVAGRQKRLSAVPGKILLLNFWAMWCEACQRDLPLLERFHNSVGDQIKIAAVSLDKEQQQRKISAYLDKLSLRSLPIYLDPDGLLADTSANTSAPFSLTRGMPVTYLITPSGSAAGYILGVADWLSGDAQKLLEYYSNV